MLAALGSHAGTHACCPGAGSAKEALFRAEHFPEDA
jgi:hypothetical protein